MINSYIRDDWADLSKLQAAQYQLEQRRKQSEYR